jgi:hypothetical protein
MTRLFLVKGIPSPVIPAKAGISSKKEMQGWLHEIPALAGMTEDS